MWRPGRGRIVSIPLRRWLLCNGRCSLLASPYSLKNLLWKPLLSHPSKSFIGRKSHFLSPSSQEAFQNQVKASCPQLRLSNTTFFQICQTFLQSRGKIGKGYEKPRETRSRGSGGALLSANSASFVIKITPPKSIPRTSILLRRLPKHGLQFFSYHPYVSTKN
jgi:hypothetical protein